MTPTIEEQIAAVERAVEHYADYARNLAEINREHGDEGSLGVEQMLVESTLAGLQSTAATLRSHAELQGRLELACADWLAEKKRATTAEAERDEAKRVARMLWVHETGYWHTWQECEDAVRSLFGELPEGPPARSTPAPKEGA